MGMVCLLLLSLSASVALTERRKVEVRLESGVCFVDFECLHCYDKEREKRRR